LEEYYENGQLRWKGNNKEGKNFFWLKICSIKKTMDNIMSKNSNLAIEEINKQISKLDKQSLNCFPKPLNETTKDEKLVWGAFGLMEFIISEQRNIGEKYKTCLDIGSGDGQHSRILSTSGLKVYQVDKYSETAQFKEDFLNISFDEKFDVIFCSHVIEHQRNVGLFLDKIFDYLSDNGVLIISAPKHPAERFIEGHLNCFIFPYFLQHLIHAGFDCKNGKFLSISELENSFIVKKLKDFSLNERTEQGYMWTDKHYNRSFYDFKAGVTIDNKASFLHNCDILSFAKSKNSPINLNFPVNYKFLNINLNIYKSGLKFKI